VIKPRAFFLCFLNTYKLQRLGPIWVGLPKDFYTKNKYKNINITKQASSKTKIHERTLFAPWAKLLHKQHVITQNNTQLPNICVLNNSRA
jgi:hypothetical protein